MLNVSESRNGQHGRNSISPSPTLRLLYLMTIDLGGVLVRCTASSDTTTDSKETNKTLGIAVLAR
jgi:hypothetical protein